MSNSIILLIVLAVLGLIAFLFLRKNEKNESPEKLLADLSKEDKELFDLAMNPKNVPHTFIYALTTCQHCRKTRALLEENNVPFTLINIDTYPQSLNKELSDKVREYNPRGSFPTIHLTNGQIITGYRENSIKEALINDPDRTS